MSNYTFTGQSYAGAGHQLSSTYIEQTHSVDYATHNPDTFNFYDDFDVYVSGELAGSGHTLEEAEQVLLLTLLQKYPQIALQAVMTTGEAEAEFDLKRSTAMKAAQRGTVEARRTDQGAWLISRASAETQWEGLLTKPRGAKLLGT